MTNAKLKSSDKLFYAGLILIPVMLIILVFSSLTRGVTGDIFGTNGTFFINYIIAFVFFAVVLISNKPFFKFMRIDRRLIIVSLILFSISTFTLNNSIPIFAQFTLWVKIYLILYYSAFLCICFIEKLPIVIRYIVFFFLGAGLVITTYFAAYLAPIYHISIIGLVFFGLSVHLLIPLFITISTIFNYIKLKKTKIEKVLFFSGIIIPISITIVFLFQWNNFKDEIHNASSSIITRPDNTLPEWVLLSQDMPTDNFSQKIIKGNLAFDTFQNISRGFGSTTFDEVKRHDPLVNIGLAFLGDINLDQNTRIKILKSQFNARHLAQRKLWSGRNLGTIEVLNNIKIYPDYRLAYSEKIITIKNFNQWEDNQQEAAYTFYLPEGSVATSLSLWIDGKEEKSRLTTKSKADSAYVSIVGVERRDPALLHWQEGNTLTVTVFPCTPKENRKFKIGITTPLEKTDNNLTLQNVYFDGPVTHNIMETSQIVFESENVIKNIQLPKGFKKGLEENYTYDGKFMPYWEASCEATTLSENKFYFNNHSYSIKEINKETFDFDPENIYLDINKSWSETEYNKILTLFHGKNIFVHHDKLISINENNKSEVFKLLRQKNFSLFSFSDVTDWNNSFFISKSTELSPNLSDLEGSEFLNELIKKINATDEKLNFFQLDKTTSPYIKSLKEFQILNFHSGDINDLSQIANEKKFYQYNSDSAKVNLDIAGISIIKDTNKVKSEAPDHLLRLFAYNQIMKQMGRNYFNKDKDYIEKLVNIANEAYVVSPVSSLIVLETQKDYERFNIKENENSLKNASVKSSGAVPEPEEWVLIILFLGIITFVFFNKKKLSVVKWK
jgi:XrtN system VIT domain protein